MVIIPLTTDPNQNFTCTVPVDAQNITLFFVFRYNTEAQYWFMSVSNATTGQILLDSIPLLTGEYPSADLLGQYTYLGIGSATIVKTGTLPGDTPNDTNLGSEYVLVWGDTVG